LKDSPLLTARVRAGIRLLRAEGPLALVRAARAAWRRDRASAASRYPEWVRRYATYDGPRLDRLRARAERLAPAPLVNIVTPVFDPPEALLREAIESVLAQVYPHWELLLVDDGSREPYVREMLAAYASRDSRIRAVFRERSGNISAATNDGLALAHGDVITFLDHDDTLTIDALYRVAREFAEHPDAQVVYSDEDKLDFAGGPAHPNFKPDWNRDLFLSHNILAHLCAYRASLIGDTGGLREGFEGAQDYDLALRAIERVKPSQVRHVPRVLYHWRMNPGSTAVNASEKEYAAERARRAVAEHLARTGVAAEVETLASLGAQRVRYHRPDGDVAVLRAGDARSCNAAARLASAEFLVFLAEGIEPSHAAIDELVANAGRGDVGVAGGVVRDGGGRILDGSYLLGARPPYRGLPRGDPGHMMRAALAQEVSAVPIDCLCVLKSRFDEVGRFDETFARAFHDVDLCLRLRARGLRTVFTPFAEFVRQRGPRISVPPDAEGFARHPAEAAILRERWGALLADDPDYNPNLSLDGPAFSLAWPPRVR
jgi:GT2 family glycosyltransferase